MTAEARWLEDYLARQGHGGVFRMRANLDVTGDSLSEGQGASPNEHWGRRLSRDLGTIGWHLHAKSGFTLAQMLELNRGKRQLTIRERRTVHLFSLWGVSNDIAGATLADAPAAGAFAAARFAELCDGVEEMLAAGYSGGVVLTMLPRVDVTSHKETARVAFNASVLTVDSLFGGRVLSVDLSQSVGLATIDGTPGWWHADDIHLLDPGQQGVADEAAPAVQQLLAA